MKCQSLLSEQNKKNIINLLFAKSALRVVKVNGELRQEFCRRRRRTCWGKSHRSHNQNVVIK